MRLQSVADISSFRLNFQFNLRICIYISISNLERITQKYSKFLTLTSLAVLVRGPPDKGLLIFHCHGSSGSGAGTILISWSQAFISTPGSFVIQAETQISSHGFDPGITDHASPQTSQFTFQQAWSGIQWSLLTFSITLAPINIPLHLSGQAPLCWQL